jgi:hypothetical protein
MPKLQEKPSAIKREHPVLKNMKILDLFLFMWVIFALPDPATQINADPCGSGSKTLSQTLAFKALWWRTVCSRYVSRLDRHVTYYTSHMLYICTYSP